MLISSSNFSCETSSISPERILATASRMASRLPLHREDGGVEALDVAHLHDREIFVRGFDDLARIEDVLGQRLLDQTRHAALEERLGERAVVVRRHADAGGGDLRKQIAQICESFAAELLRDILRFLMIRVVDAEEVDVAQLGVDARVETSHASTTDYRDGEHFLQFCFLCVELCHG